MERLFVAIPLADETVAELARHLAGRELAGRPVPPANWHLTLRFLGESDRERRSALEAALGAAHLGPPFEVAFGALGAFPRPSRASVVWMAVHDRGGELRALAARVEEAARASGYPPEQKPFTPHLTVARIRMPQDVALPLQRVSPSGARMMVDSVHLMVSHPGARQPRYSSVATWTLS